MSASINKKNAKLDSFPVEAPGQLDVDDAFGVDGAGARVLEEAHKDLAGLLKLYISVKIYIKLFYIDK